MKRILGIACLAMSFSIATASVTEYTETEWNNRDLGSESIGFGQGGFGFADYIDLLDDYGTRAVHQIEVFGRGAYPRSALFFLTPIDRHVHELGDAGIESIDFSLDARVIRGGNPLIIDDAVNFNWAAVGLAIKQNNNWFIPTARGFGNGYYSITNTEWMSYSVQGLTQEDFSHLQGNDPGPPESIDFARGGNPLTLGVVVAFSTPTVSPGFSLSAIDNAYLAVHDSTPVSPVPVPAAAWLFGIGGLAFVRKRSNR